MHRRLAPPKELRAWEDTLSTQDPARLGCAYPATPGCRPGITLLSWHVSPSDLVLETVHTYPDEAVIVTTRSTAIPLPKA